MPARQGVPLMMYVCSDVRLPKYVWIDWLTQLGRGKGVLGQETTPQLPCFIFLCLQP